MNTPNKQTRPLMQAPMPESEADASHLEKEQDDTNLTTTHPFDPALIRIQTTPALIDGIIKRIKHGEIDLTPDFQRKARLWPVENKFPLQGMEYLTQLNDQTFQTLPRTFQRRIEETSLAMNVILAGTPEEVMINIFKRINTGGMPLSAQEVRNALYKGKVRELLKTLAESPELSAAATGPVNDIDIDLNLGRALHDIGYMLA